jgi:hypothetical protein
MFNQVRLSSLTATLGAALLAATAIPQLRAGEADKMTTVTFSAPVEISGLALPAGTYVFRTLGDDRETVVVMNREDNRVVAMPHAVPADAPFVTDKTRLEMSEGAANAPEVLRYWFYPGDSNGWEFPAAKTGKKALAASAE